jgi:hypothetical protein
MYRSESAVQLCLSCILINEPFVSELLSFLTGVLLESSQLCWKSGIVNKLNSVLLTLHSVIAKL